MSGRGLLAPLVAVLVLAGLAVSVLMVTHRRGNDAPTLAAGKPAIVSPDDLKDAADKAKTPIFWAGTGPGDHLELTRTSTNRWYVRYLPDGVDAGDKRAAFLTVGTYPQTEAYSIAAASARRKGMVRRATPGGGLATWSRSKPTSVYVAYPGVRRLVEVFSPNAADARRLVLSGEVGPAGEVQASEPAPKQLLKQP